ncbi:folylpolyglutamate synthase/dihydrofolate synthase family protein [Aquimarina sp. RZ0]|uniref:bifunctional folylpolyglutamate synthase/dihydrofolate synthase n=1 Tax=Aquimarina sp. RZ0 TaxID=2607730 RepID=UPI0011F2B4F4|nr:folylpolyglutamate synthase/dihydrofolate synthase family protein [Aquimarina sp. RZ0]KAA1242432.1 bifunctional folylpolyglutamate synthase/dihydrofolate synthase [Aquimarina sp. RZ0]
MNYRETLEWMFAQLPMYQRQGATAYKADLTNTLQLASYLKNPEDSFKSIHVGGTNGKGSTSHMLASILQQAGYKVGLYTSPHLKDFRERIRINGQEISEKYVIDFIEVHKTYFEEKQLSFFEMTVGLAFQYFADSTVDIAIVEVGLGGRLDSTNIITPEVSVITNIGIDHTQFLGNTLKQIAIEKAGIIKKSIPVVIGSTALETKKIFKEKAFLCKSELFMADTYKDVLFETDLKGNYQKENMRTTLQVISVLQKQGWNVSEENIRKGLNSVISTTGLRGRWHVLRERPKVICDTAHNEDGLRSIMKQLLAEQYERLHIVLGMVNDKELYSILPIFPSNANYYFTKPDISRGLDEEILQKEALEFGLKGGCYPTVEIAYKSALQKATSMDLIYVGGSTFVVAEII